MDPFTPHETPDDWIVTNANPDSELDEELRALIDIGMPRAPGEHNADGELDEELNSLINHDFDSPRAAQEHNTMQRDGSTFASSAMMQMDIEYNHRTSPGYTAVMQQVDYQDSNQRTQSDSNAGNMDIQRQLNELRQVVSALLRDKQQATERRRLNEAALLFESSSFRQTENERSRRSSGLSTPIDEYLLPFGPTDDSQGLSRTSSAASMGSSSHKRARKIPDGYPCIKCSAKFDLPSKLRKHESIHLSYDERPYACSQCDQRFIYPKDVTRHERQAHDLHRAGEEEPLDAGSATVSQADQAPAGADHVRGSEEPKGKRRPKRNIPAIARARERHARSLRQSRISFDQDSGPSTRPTSQVSSSGRRRDSGIPSEHTDEDQSDLSLPDPNFDLAEAVGRLRLQVSDQHKTISDLQRELNEHNTNARKWRIERDQFAAMLAQMDNAEAEQQTANPRDLQNQQPVQSERPKDIRDDVDFDDFIIYTAKSPRQLEQATKDDNE